MSKCEYCDFKIKDYNDDYESTLGFNNRWSGANLLECTKTHEEVDAENGVLYKGKYYLSVGGDDEGFLKFIIAQYVDVNWRLTLNEV